MAPPSATNDDDHRQDVVDSTTNRATAAKKNSKSMPPFAGPPQFDDKYEEREYLKGRLTAAFRIFGKLGFEEGVAGHITLRDPVNPQHFWVNPFGKSFRLMKRSDLILVNEKGEVIDGGENRMLNTAAYMIHHAVHQARPDVICAAHSHSLYGRAFTTMGRGLDTITQDSCAFHGVRILSATSCRVAAD
jgi:ribulose-5-phosphate 4-epimerase/fuculose-1-phosphate aldolase